MNGPAVLIVLDDKKENARVLAEAWGRHCPPELREFLSNCQRKVWIYARDGIEKETVEKHREEAREHYSSVCPAESLEECNKYLHEHGKEHLDTGVLVYLDVLLDETVCKSTDECVQSSVVRTLNEWISNETGKILVHVHSTDAATHLVVNAVDPRRKYALGEFALPQGAAGEQVFELVRASRAAWLKAFPDDVDSFWPAYTKKWFKLDNRGTCREPISTSRRGALSSEKGSVPHNFCLKQDSTWPELLRNFAEGTLARVGSGGLPDKWFDGRGGLKCVHSAVKSFVGGASVAQGGHTAGERSRNLTLGGVALLFLCAIHRKGFSSEALFDWDVHVHSKTSKVLSGFQSPREARESIYYLLALFETLVVHKRDQGVFVVERVVLDSQSFRVALELRETDARELVAVCRRTFEGERAERDFQGALGDFLDRARVAGDRVDQRCVLNFWVSEHNPNRVIMEIRAC